MSDSILIFYGLKLTSQIICMSIRVTMPKKYTNANDQCKAVFDGFFSVLARDGFLLSDFHDANYAFRIRVFE